jgi:hypothetical protein
MLQVLRVLSAECNFHGFLFKGECFCEKQYDGTNCEIKSTFIHIKKIPQRISLIGDRGIYDTDDKCEAVSAKLDYLDNISADYYPGDDDMFSRLDDTSIGQGQAAYGDISNSWISNYWMMPQYIKFQ